jgi:hypothetical protein
MATRAKGPLAGFGWLKNAINLGNGNPKAVFGGAALVALLSLVPSVITLPIQLAVGTGTDMLPVVMGISMLCGLLLVPLIAGYLRIVDAADRGLATRATDVFAPYRGGEAPRLMGFGVAMLLAYLVMFALVVAIAGSELVDWYGQVLAAQGKPEAMPADLPEGFGRGMVAAIVLGLLMMGVYAISLGQVALGGRSVVDSVRDGFVGSFKNVLPLVVLALAGIVVGLVFVLVFGVLMSVVMLVAKLAGQWLVFALMVPLYLGLMVTLFVVMFGVMYHLWRDVCGEASSSGPAERTLAA